VPPPASIAQRLRRRLHSAVAERVPLKAAALFFAIVLWLIVTSEEPSEELVPVRFVPTLDSTLTLRAPVPAVQALVIGSTRELLKLYSSPPAVRRVVGADAPDDYVVDLRPADVDLPSGVKAIVRDVQPRRVTLHLERAPRADAAGPRALRSDSAGGDAARRPATP
jgi:hypothetical protein